MKVNKEFLELLSQSYPGEFFIRLIFMPNNYLISNYGRVINTGVCIGKVDGRKQRFKPRFMSLPVNDKGYPTLYVRSKGKKLALPVHQLVAKAFIPNWHNKPVINHKDGNKQNNYWQNLEWCTYLENNNHAVDTGLKKTQPVSQYDLKGNFIADYVSIPKASIASGISTAGIRRTITGEFSQCGGYIWKSKTN
jgi:hypothetical protein